MDGPAPVISHLLPCTQWPLEPDMWMYVCARTFSCVYVSFRCSRTHAGVYRVPGRVSDGLYVVNRLLKGRLTRLSFLPVSFSLGPPASDLCLNQSETKQKCMLSLYIAVIARQSTLCTRDPSAYLPSYLPRNRLIHHVCRFSP